MVFFGLTGNQERDILEDIENAGVMKRKIAEDDWEVEECHFAVRICNHETTSHPFLTFLCSA